MKNPREVCWGILGCGDVCEVKSGPAFNKVENSRLVAVMRRDPEKVKDFAARHRVPKYYTDARELINDAEVNAVYIATPPAYHEAYTLDALRAGKPVYIEKPVALDATSCTRMLEASRSSGIKASVAHYRRGLPTFKKIKSLLHSGIIGKPSLINCRTLQAPKQKMDTPGYWRTNPEMSGGGLFFDLAPHQLDIFYWLFGKPLTVRGYSTNQKKLYQAPDLTNAEVLFSKDVYLHAIWAFNVATHAEEETCEIFGEKGKISFSFFRASEITISTSDGVEKIALEYPVNIQQPMIDEVVKFFRDEGANPCSLEDALVTMEMMDATK